MPRSRTSNGTKDSSTSLGFEAKLWLAADNLRSNMDAAPSYCARTLLPKLLSGDLSVTTSALPAMIESITISNVATFAAATGRGSRLTS